MMKMFGVVVAAAALVASANAMAQDAAAGEKAFGKCKACHTVTGKNTVGPALNGVVGRAAGTANGFKYSDAMKGSGITWTAETIDKYLADPKGFVPKNKMVFPGIKDAAERANVIAYLAQQK